MTIETHTITTLTPDSIQAAARVLRAGGLVAFPTDTVYGVGALIDTPGALERLFTVKERPSDKPIPVLLADGEDMEPLAAGVTPEAERLIRRFWPGPLTIVVLAKVRLPEQVAPEGTVGLRVPDHDFARRLLRETGPLAVTSANLSGSPSAVTVESVEADLAGKIELIIDGGRTPGGIASTVVDCSSARIRILREGLISADEINALLG